MPRFLRLAVALLLASFPALAAFPRITGYGPVLGAPGTVVTITGQNFSGLTDVFFGNTRAAVQFANATQIRAIVPGDALSGAISVYTTGGQDSTQALTIPYFQVAPRIEVFYREFGADSEPVIPAKAVIGDRIYVRGANFDDPNRPANPGFGLGVFVNGVRATQGAVTSPANLQFIVPPGTGTGPVTVTNFAGAAVSTQLLYLQPVITGFTARGAIGDTIDLRGTSFTGVTAVKFGNLNAASFTVQSGTNLTAVVPANAVNGPLTVTAPGGAYITVGNFLVLPSITGFTPVGGSPGTVVTIDGTALTGTTAVRFGGFAADRFTNISATRITAVVPNAAVSAPISVVTANGTNSSAANFFLAPVITGFTPLQGSAGTPVKITGKSFTGVTAVSLGALALTGFTVDSATQISFTLPAAARSGLLQVTGPGGSDQSAAQFRVLGFEPAISEFRPPFGGIGTQVTLIGGNLAAVTNVTFNGVKATFAVVNGTDLVALVPPGATTGPLEVKSLEGTFATARDFFIGTTTDLRTTLVVTENPAVAHGPLVATWRLTNLGLVPATNAVGHLTLPAGVTYYDASTSVPFTLVGDDLRLNAGTIDPGNTVTLVLRMLVGPPGSLPFATTVSNGVTDSNPANNASNLALTARTPRLSLERLPLTGLALSWSAAGTNYVAERQALLGPGPWTPVAGQPDNDGATLQLLVPEPDDDVFFRVRLRE